MCTRVERLYCLLCACVCVCVCVQIPTGEKYYFYCGRWLGPECLTVELPASLLDPTHARRKYKVRTHTDTQTHTHTHKHKHTHADELQ